MLSVIRLVSQIFGKKLIKLTEQNLSHKDFIKKNNTLSFSGWRTRTRLKMRTRWTIFKCKVRDNSTPKMILGACWGTRVLWLTIPCQACPTTIPPAAIFFGFAKNQCAHIFSVLAPECDRKLLALFLSNRKLFWSKWPFVFLLDEWLNHKERSLYFIFTWRDTLLQSKIFIWILFLYNDRLLILETGALMVIHVLCTSRLLAYMILIFTHYLIKMKWREQWTLIWLLSSD